MFDWVEGVLSWFIEVFKEIFTALWEIFSDIGVFFLETLLDIVLLVIGYLTLPSFIVGGLAQYFADIDPSILYFLSKSGLSAGAELIGAGVMFRLTRKLLTLGQW